MIAVYNKKLRKEYRLLAAFLESWQDRLATRSRNLLAGAAQLDAYLTILDQTSPGCRSANG
ncbi:hypothetical protein BS618_15055 [Rhodococcus erythropolis]|nr:hypothetical protein BS618_15055 [Rhodococcus erythropolis]